MQTEAKRFPRRNKSMATFTNQATLFYNNTRTSSNIVSGEILGVLSAEKTALSGSYNANDVITYVVSIVNAGASAFNGLSLSDDLGAYSFSTGSLVPLDYVDGSLKYYVNGVLQPDPAVSAGAPLTISDFSVPANGNALLVYSARANGYAPLGRGGEIVNTATISGGGLIAPLTADATVNAQDGVCLSLSKALSPATITENGRITYTLTIYNYGASEVVATDDVIISDSFDPVLDISSVSFNGESWTSPANYSYSSDTGIFSTNAGQITVPAAAFTQDTATGEWNVTPGVSTLVITGTV